MNKREMIHALIDRVLDIEESSKKGVNINYSTLSGVDFYFTARPEHYTHWLGDRITCRFKDPWTPLEEFTNSMKRLNEMLNTPDVDPKIRFEFTEFEAREKGLIL